MVLCSAMFESRSPRGGSLDVQTKVSVDILKRVYDAFQKNGEAGEGEDDFLDPEAHLYFIDAFEMPLWNWSTEKGTFDRCACPHSCHRCLYADLSQDMQGH